MAGSPFLICSRSQLEKISMGLGKHYELGQNIDLQDDPFEPISGSLYRLPGRQGLRTPESHNRSKYKTSRALCGTGHRRQYPESGYSRSKCHKRKHQRYKHRPCLYGKKHAVACFLGFKGGRFLLIFFSPQRWTRIPLIFFLPQMNGRARYL